MDFLEYMTSLAPEGETFLIVRQKPRLQDGEIQLHVDGAVKATWPAFLPNKPRPDGQSWYGNTASFILDRFTDGKISASAANCEYVLCMVLDDVGDPEKAPKTPPLAPTWVMETSPGSFQWGYAFTEEQPTKAEYSAAITAIAAAGYSDKGAVNPVRNFRLPGSVNLKPGRDGFVSRLVEFHPERQFSLPQICEALGVTPAEEAATFRPIRVSDDGADDVLAWLSDQGLVLSKPNAQGWAGIVCPNSSEHSDGNPEGRYNPSMRAFCCLHSHCIDLDSVTFLKWVGEQGGPHHAPGLRDELLASMMTDALGKLHPTEAFPDEAKRVIAEVERKELGRTEKADWYKRFCYVQEGDHYFDLQDRREISRSTFNALFRHIECRSLFGKRPKIEASYCFDENRQDMGAKALVGITYAAGEGVLVARDGDVYGNRWRDARPAVGAAGADISFWLDHCAALVPEVSEREHIFNVMAYKVQHPEIKINHAVLHGGDQGCGKDTLWAPFIWAVCGPQLKNRGLLDNDTLGSQWGYALESEILILNELKEPEAKERRALANKLKPIIAAPPDMLTVNRKGLHPYDSLNRMFVLAFSNDPVPITIDSQDRRWFCVWSSAPRMAPDAAARLWAWYKTGGGYEAIAAWLKARDVSAFNPSAAPAWTEFKANLVEHGMSIAESYLVEMMRARRGEFARGAVGSPFHALCDRVAASAPSGVKVPQAALLHALKEAGWVDCGRLKSRANDTKKHIFCAPDMVQHSRSELRDLVEEPASPLMVRVK
jgi:hypothetical protein